jgi:hypothetical protein
MKSPSWLKNFCTQIQNEISTDGDYLEQHAKSLLEIGNRNILMIGQDQAGVALSRYKLWNDDFNKQFWDSIKCVDTKLLQKWINFYLQINHFSYYELFLKTKVDSAIELDWLAIKMEKHNQKLENLKKIISCINSHNSTEIHAIVARTVSINQREIPDHIYNFMQKKSPIIEELQKKEFSFDEIEPVMTKNYLEKELNQNKKILLEETKWNEISTSHFFGLTQKKKKCKQLVAEIITKNENLDILQQFKLCSQLLEKMQLLNDGSYSSIYKDLKKMAGVV